MTHEQKFELEQNLNLKIIDTKLNALKSALSEDQLMRYLDSIQREKKKLSSQLEKVLSPEQVVELLKALDN